MNHQRSTITQLLRLCPAALLCTTAAACNFQQADQSAAISQTPANLQANLSVQGEGVGVAANYGTVDARQSVAGSAPMNVHLVGGSPQHERRREPHEYYVQGETFMNSVPPNWQEAFEVFLYAANAIPPHPGACIRCAEYFERKIPSDIENALRYYNIALSTAEKPQGAYRGLMKLHHRVGVQSTRPLTKKVNFQKAQEYGAQITIPILTDDDILNEIDHQLEQLNVPSVALPVPMADAVNTTTPAVISSMISPSRIDPLPIPPSSHMSLNTSLDQRESHTTITQLITDMNRGVKKALDKLISIAENGSMEACVALIDLYDAGVAVKKDPAKVFYFTIKAAEIGDIDYQLKVAKAYGEGIGAQQDSVEAARFDKLASDFGHHPVAQYALARMYEQGMAVLQNNDEAHRYYTLAARQNYHDAIAKLADAYVRGTLTTNDINAVEWYRKHVDIVLLDAFYALAAAFERGISLNADMSDLIVDEKQAFLWYKKAAKKNHNPALLKVVDFYREERAGLAGASAEAIHWYKKASLVNYEGAIVELALCYMNGYASFQAKSPDAIKIYKKAAAFNHTPSLFQLVDIYISKMLDYISIDPNILESYQRAATLQFMPAQLQLGKMYHKGTWVDIDYIEAKRWYQMAANQGSRDAIHIIQSGVLNSPPPSLPSYARGYGEVYQRFINGKIIFDNKNGQRREFDIKQFANKLEGEFDLRGLTTTYNNRTYTVSDHFRVKVGVRKAQENEDKVTVWLTPKFLLDTTSSHPWKTVDWKSPMGIMWTYGQYDMDSFDYLTSQQFDEISNQNLEKLVDRAVRVGCGAVCGVGCGPCGTLWGRLVRVVCAFILRFN